MSFDSDGTLFVINNSANCHIYNNKTLFIDLYIFTEAEQQLISTARGDARTVGFRKVNLSWIDDKGNKYQYNVNDVYYYLSSNVNLIRITKFGK